MGSSSAEGVEGERKRQAAICVGALFFVLAVLFAASYAAAPAWALGRQGHVFSSSFGEAGEGDGQLDHPDGVAVSEVGPAAGDVYVVDRGNNRVERFGPEGRFLSAWGFGVATGARESQVCTSDCKAGLPGPGRGAERVHLAAAQLLSPEGIAIDNSPSSPSAGDVYVVADSIYENSYVDKFSAEGQFLGRVTNRLEAEEYGRVDGVAVDPTGEVWVAWQEDGRVTRYGDDVGNKRATEEEDFEASEAGESGRPGFAVGQGGRFYLNLEPGLQFVEAGGGEKGSEEHKGPYGEEPCEPALPCEVARFSVSPEEGEEVLVPDFGEEFTEGLFGETSDAIASDPATGEVLIDHLTSVSALEPDGQVVEKFGSPQLREGSGVAIDAGNGTVYVADEAADQVDVFPLETAARSPEVDGLHAAHVSTTGAELLATIDAGGAETTVSFEYGSAPCVEGGCVALPGNPGSLPAKFGDQASTVTLSNLAPGVTYHYRVKASGTTTTVSGEHTFTTTPIPLPDGREWELVSPAQKQEAGYEAAPKEGGLIEASEDGTKITYLATGPSEANPEGNRSPAFTQNLAIRIQGATGPEWSSSEVEIPGPEVAPGIAAGQVQEYQAFSSDLSKSIILPYNSGPKAEPALSLPAKPEEAGKQEKTIYLRRTENCQAPPSECFTAIVNDADDTASPRLPFGGPENELRWGVKFVEASPNLEHVVLESEVPLTEEPAAAGRNLYEWTPDRPADEQLQLVNRGPGNEPLANAALGFRPKIRRDTVSEDGSRVVFETEINTVHHLYVRDMEAGTTVRLDVPEEGVGTTEESGEPVFQAASDEDGLIFFTDEQRLTATSTSRDQRSERDLYVYDVATNKLTDLTVPLNPNENANVQGLVAGTSTDGSTVYFVADGVLTDAAAANGEKATPGSCRRESPVSLCNLYVERLDGETWEAPHLVARLAYNDYPDWGLPEADLGDLSDRASPNGDYFAFMSQRSLTGFNTRDTNPLAEGARAEEVYLYHLEGSTESLTCASCSPDGQQPEGVHVVEESGEGLGLLVNRDESWGGAEPYQQHWLAGSVPGWAFIEIGVAHYQPRYLDNNGRLFFDSPEPLVPADQNGKEDVYEYEGDGLGSCGSANGCLALISSGTSDRESAFLDASATGDDVFFLTAAALTSQDTGSSYDVYDAHVCSESSPCATPPPPPAKQCVSAPECERGETTVPAYAPPMTSSLHGTGNLPAGSVLPEKVEKSKPLTNAQKLAKALKACKKFKNHRKRSTCERQARKKYPVKRKTAKK